LTQNELNYIIDALAEKNNRIISGIVELDTFKKNALAEKTEETKKTKKEKSE
jgi:hypothetical protein